MRYTLLGILGLAGAIGFMVPACTVAPSEPVVSEDYTLRQEHDSLYWLNEWRLPYPVYRFCTGDVNGDGQVNAIVGVVKSTRFHPEVARRVFIFKQVGGKVRPLWLGSRLGGTLVDFCFVDGRIRALETDRRGMYGVVEYQWEDFGMYFHHLIIKDTDRETALKYFEL